MTSLALYLSLPEGLHRLEEKSLHAFVAEEFASADPDLRPFFDLPLSRVYAGAEFCTHLLPGPVAIGKLAAVLRRVNIPFTFVTPPTPQNALGRVRRILSCLERLAAGGEEAIEVVINDWGVLRMMKRYPALQPVLEGTDAWLDEQATRLLDIDTQHLNAAVTPVIGAALQVHWTHLARQLDPAQVARPEHPNLCPVCGSHPVSSVVRIGGAESGLRYLHCTLCNSEWHVVRAKCSNCDNTRDIGYYHLEVAPGRFGLFLRGPKESKAGVDAVARGLIALLK